MTFDKQAPLTEEYWRSFALSDEELEHLHDLILGRGIPQMTTALVYEVVERCCQAQAETAKAEAVRQQVVPYDPRETFQEGQRLLFARFGIARVTETWPENHSYFGEYLAMRVRNKATGRISVFVAGIQRGFENFDPPKLVEEAEGWAIGKPTPYVTPGEVVEQFGDYARRKLTNRLGEDERFVNFGQEWFLTGLLESISRQELTLAEKRIRPASEPLKLADLASLPDKPQTVEAFVQHFSWNYALENDTRFDNVGTADMPLWFLRELEPPEVITKPERLAIPVVQYTREYEYIHEELVQVAKDLDDETEEKSPPPAEFTQTREPVRFVLNFSHLTAGSVPLTNRIRQAFPRPAGPRSRVTFVDARSGARLAGWVMHEERYAWGLKEWYDTYGIRAGNYVILQATETPTEIRVDFDELSQPRVERVRVAIRGKDGSWRFEWQEREVRYRYDPLMFIAETRFEELESLDWEAEQVGKPIFEVMCDLFPALAEVEGDEVHAKTLYQAVNLVRRCAPGTVFCQLSQRVCFASAGDGYWTYNPDRRDVKYVKPGPPTPPSPKPPVSPTPPPTEKVGNYKQVIKALVEYLQRFTTVERLRVGRMTGTYLVDGNTALILKYSRYHEEKSTYFFGLLQDYFWELDRSYADLYFLAICGDTNKVVVIPGSLLAGIGEGVTSGDQLGYWKIEVYQTAKGYELYLVGSGKPRHECMAYLNNYSFLTRKPTRPIALQLTKERG